MGYDHGVQSLATVSVCISPAVSLSCLALVGGRLFVVLSLSSLVRLVFGVGLGKVISWIGPVASAVVVSCGSVCGGFRVVPVLSWSGAVSSCTFS